MAASNLTPEALLAQYPPPVAELARALCDFIRAQLPEAKEVAYAGWRAVGFRHPQAGYVSGVFLSDDQVKVVFEHGNLLPDPDGVLEGDTKQTRHITLVPGDPLPLGPLAALLQAAVAVGSGLRTRHGL